jgi:hypothetical protein
MKWTEKRSECKHQTKTHTLSQISHGLLADFVSGKRQVSQPAVEELLTYFIQFFKSRRR